MQLQDVKKSKFGGITMNNKIDIVITMGGLGSRFRKMGYTVPKYMIEAKEKTLFEWSLISLEGYKKKY